LLYRADITTEVTNRFRWLDSPPTLQSRVRPAWDDDSRSARLVWNPKVHYRLYKSPTLSSILNHIPVQQQPHITAKMYFNVIFPSLPRPPK
jgi:hypothetical protein